MIRSSSLPASRAVAKLVKRTPLAYDARTLRAVSRKLKLRAKHIFARGYSTDEATALELAWQGQSLLDLAKWIEKKTRKQGKRAG